VAVTAPNGTATLSWAAPTVNTDGTPVTPLSGYHIYYGMTQGDLAQSVAVSGGATATYEITGLASGTWYFAIAADAMDGAEGPQSSIGSTTI
jgi:Fibronectin type III domain